MSRFCIEAQKIKLNSLGYRAPDPIKIDEQGEPLDRYEGLDPHIIKIAHKEDHHEYASFIPGSPAGYLRQTD